MRLHKPRQRQRQIKPTSTWILISLLRNPPRPQYESASSSFQMNVNGQWAWSSPSVPSPLLRSLQLTSDRRDACSLIHAQYRLSNGQAGRARSVQYSRMHTWWTVLHLVRTCEIHQSTLNPRSLPIGCITVVCSIVSLVVNFLNIPCLSCNVIGASPKHIRISSYVHFS